MRLGKVNGQVVATVRVPGLPGTPLLVVEFLDGKGEPTGECHVAADLIGAGRGEVVLLVSGSSARKVMDREAPVDLTIVGIVDTIAAGSDIIYSKQDGQAGDV